VRTPALPAITLAVAPLKNSAEREIVQKPFTGFSLLQYLDSTDVGMSRPRQPAAGARAIGFAWPMLECSLNPIPAGEPHGCPDIRAGQH
jgi:hypothetical protein